MAARLLPPPRRAVLDANPRKAPSPVALGFLVVVAACAPPAQRLDRLTERDPYAGLSAATQWLDKHDPEHPARAEVEEAEARAAFAIAALTDTAGAWSTYQVRYPEPEDLRREARRREASAAWRDVATAVDTVESYRRFREAYPDAFENALARRREVAVAAAAAKSAEGLSALQEFRETYAEWPEAEAARDELLVVEMERALAAARRVGSSAAYRSWLERYDGEAGERVAPSLLGEAHHLADRAIADDAVGVLLREPWDPARLSAWLKRDGALPALGEAALAHREALLQRAAQAGGPDGWYVVAVLLAATPDGPALMERARGAAWAAAADPSQAGRFAARFPDDPRAWDAEGRWLAWRERTAPRARQARVQRRKVLPTGEVELTVDVVDCAGTRLAGLTRESFTLWDGEEKVPISAFSSLEQDRPLDLVVAVDLSGSMATERAAVDAAVGRFAETLRFRNRAVSIGLVGFSDGVRVNEAPTARTSDFRRWLRLMPDNLGGGAEDTAGGLLAAAEQLRRAHGERVVVLLSDEHLQVNYRGHRALGLAETGCDQARSVAGCLGSCGDDDGCMMGCMTNGPARFAAQVRGCAGQGLWCAGSAMRRVLEEAQRCQDVDDHPELPSVLSTRMLGADVRTYALATVEESGGYLALTTATGGRTLPVPDDADRPAPYEAALLDIADQLSKQYVVTYRPASTTEAEPVVSPDWRWSEAPFPSDARPGVPQLRPDDDSPARLRVEADGSVSRSLDGAAWRTVLGADAGRKSLVSTTLDTALVCTDGDSGIWCSRDLGRSWGAISAPAEAGPVRLATTERGLHAQQGQQAWTLLRVRSRDLPASALYFETNADRFEPALEPFLDELGAALEARPELRLRVDGHADARGSDAYNDELALRRATRVAEAILAKGGRPEQISVRSFGERQPVRLGSTQADYQRNRRVELILLEPPPEGEALCR